MNKELIKYHDLIEMLNSIKYVIPKDKWRDIDERYINPLKEHIINLQEENEELKYENNILKQELEKKKEECSFLIEEINPYQRYGISERDFH